MSLLTDLSFYMAVAFFMLVLPIGAVYRLYFSPLAKFPGPRLAALTLWYEFYYDVIKRGKYTWEIQKMHQKYGPIVRINPYELHVADPDFYDQLYTGPSKPHDKYEWSARMFGNPLAAVGTVPHEHHRMRRAALNPYFSKQSIQQLMPVILSKIKKLCQRFEEFQTSKQPLCIDVAYSALTMDIITEYCFAEPYGCLDEPEFTPQWPKGLMEASETSHLNKQFSWLLPLMMSLPDWVVARASPNIMALLNYRKVLVNQMESIMESPNISSKSPSRSTIFHELLSCSLPPAEKALDRLVDEGISVVAAGTLTTAHFLKTTTYYLLANPVILAKLKAELIRGIPDPEELPALRDIEAMPYLRAVIQEGFRLSYGVTGRLPRVSPKTPLQYKDWIIPAGTPVGMTSIIIHENPSLFPDPKKFNPDRWMGKGAEHLDKYLVNFSKGTRSCLGIYLAQAEIYLTVAAVFRRFNFELFQTDQSDVDVVHDFFNPSPKLDSKGVRVFVNQSDIF